MTLVDLVDCLSSTSEECRWHKAFAAFSRCLSVLSMTDNRQAPKKLNEINACRLSILVAPTEGVGDRQAPALRCRQSEIKTRPARLHLAGGGYFTEAWA